jgi:hypothetical protein
MDDLQYWKIIKWVLIVLLAGFIGQFGKSLAKYIMEKTRAKRAREESSPAPPSTSTDGALSGDTDHPALITTPSQGNAAVLPEDNRAADQAKEEAKLKKKELKALAKHKKKEAKSLEKGEE